MPDLEPVSDENTAMSTARWRSTGRRLHLVAGEAWLLDWVEPAEQSYIVGDDRPVPTTPFIVAADGSKKAASVLRGATCWLWFRPSVVAQLLTQRGASLSWNSKETATVTLPGHSGVYFGLNDRGLVTVFAKDVASLPDWQQRVWSGYNVAPDGGVSSELYAAQAKGEWATSTAPEEELQSSIASLEAQLQRCYGKPLLRSHSALRDLVKQAHRFAALDGKGLLTLAKNLFRITVERFDEAKINELLALKGKNKLRSLKGLEHLAAARVGDDAAFRLLTPLHDLGELRHADSHLPSSDLSSAYGRCGLDGSVPHVLQATRLISSVAAAMTEICRAFALPSPS